MINQPYEGPFNKPLEPDGVYNFTDQFSNQGKSEIYLNRLRKTDALPYHGKRHISETVYHASEIANRAELGSLNVSESLVTVVAQYHDIHLNINPAAHPTERSEVISAKIMRDDLYQQLDVINKPADIKAEIDAVIFDMQVAILATAVDKKKAAPYDFGGDSTIEQFDLINKAIRDEALAQGLVQALGYDLPPDEEQVLIKRLQNGHENTLAIVMCAADLAHFAEQDETVFWEMSVRYGLEVGALNIDVTEESVVDFLRSQQNYIGNYKYPIIPGVSETLEEQRHQKIQIIDAKIAEGNLVEWYHQILNSF